MAASYYANQVLDALRVSSPEDLQMLDLIAWERRAMVRFTRLMGAEARLTACGRQAVITISSAVTNPRRQRFSIAHELGHWEMHRAHLGALGLIVCTKSDIDNEALRRQQDVAQREWEANEFAGALLLPDRFFLPMCADKDPSLDLIREIADSFNVSVTATALRYVSSCGEPCAVVYSEGGFIRWHRGSRAFDRLKLFIDWGSELSSSTLADRSFQGRSVPRVTKHVPASAWFAPGSYHADASVREQSLPMPGYGAVLTLLWVDDDLEPDEEDAFP